MMTCKVNEAASSNFFFHHKQFTFTLLNNCLTHSHTSRTIASSQYHPRETRSLIGQPNLYKKSFIGFADDEIVSYKKIFFAIILLIRYILNQQNGCCKRFAYSSTMRLFHIKKIFLQTFCLFVDDEIVLYKKKILQTFCLFIVY